MILLFNSKFIIFMIYASIIKETPYNDNNVEEAFQPFFKLILSLLWTTNSCKKYYFMFFIFLCIFHWIWRCQFIVFLLVFGWSFSPSSKRNRYRSYKKEYKFEWGRFSNEHASVNKFHHLILRIVCSFFNMFLVFTKLQ